MAKGFRSEAKCNPLNSKKLQIENQKKLKLSTKKKEKIYIKRITASVDCSFESTLGSCFSNTEFFSAQRQYNSYNSEKLLLKNQKKNTEFRKKMTKLFSTREMQF